MKPEPESPSNFDEDNEPDREGDAVQQPAQMPDEQISCGGHLCIEGFGIKIDVWGKDLRQCRLYAYDALKFLKKNFEKPDVGGDGIR